MSYEEEDFENNMIPPTATPKSAFSVVSIIAVISTATIIIGMVTFLRSALRPADSSSTFTSTTFTLVEPEIEDVYPGKSPWAFTLKRLGYEPLPYFTDVDLTLKYKFLEELDFVVEPGADMRLHSLSGDNSTLLESNQGYFKFSICSSDETRCQEGVFAQNEASESSGVVSFSCEPQRTTFSLEVVLIEDSRRTRVFQGKGLCLYVRREIRALSESDLSTFLDASHVLWEIEDGPGQLKFGEDFHSNSFLLGFHQFNAAQRDADHVHDGNGFLLQHLKFTNIFEKSVQSVDPSVALPYWDFTIDTAEGKNKPYESFVFTPSIYGSITLPTTFSRGFTYAQDDIIAAAIPDGRWAGLKAEYNNQFSDLRYGYGYMRAPWSMNPSPYISRFAKDSSSALPSCSNHYTMVTDYSKMMDFFYKSSYAPHATVHSLTGSMFGCDLFEAMIPLGYVNNAQAAGKICSGWPFSIKELYRKGHLTPKKDCELNTADYKQSKCGYECSAENMDSITTFLLTHYSTDIDTTRPDAGEFWTNFTCSGDGYKVYPGDHIESASPADPSFWVIHPTLERLFQAKLLAGGFEDESWATDAKNDYVCTYAKCVMDDLDVMDYYPHCCDGHFEDSRLLNAISGKRFDYYGPTNAEVLAATDPRSKEYSMSYIYEHFEWKHCADSAHDIAGYLKGLAK